MPIKLVPALTGVSMVDPIDGQRKIVTNFQLGGTIEQIDGTLCWSEPDGSTTPLEYREMTDKDRAQKWVGSNNED